MITEATMLESSTSHGSKFRAPGSRHSVRGMKTNDVWQRLERTTASDGLRLMVASVSFRQVGSLKFWEAETDHGTRYARFLNGKLVVQKVPFGQEAKGPRR